MKHNRLCVLSPTPHYGRREKESGKWEHEGENLRGEGKAPLERLPLSPWVVSLVHSSNVIAQNSEPEKCYPTNRTIGSLITMLFTKTLWRKCTKDRFSSHTKKVSRAHYFPSSTHFSFPGCLTTPFLCNLLPDSKRQ